MQSPPDYLTVQRNHQERQETAAHHRLVRELRQQQRRHVPRQWERLLQALRRVRREPGTRTLGGEV